MNRPLPEPYRDIALLIARVVLGVVMFAHGYQKMVINGIGRTTDGFETLSIPLAIISASFVTVVEFAGSALLIAGALTPFVAACNLVIMGGAVVFVHAKNGIFVADGGWELVGVIGAGFILLAAVGPGRFSVDHLINNRQREDQEALAKATAPRPQGPAHRSQGPGRPLPAQPVTRPADSQPDARPTGPAAGWSDRWAEGGRTGETPVTTDLWTPPAGLESGTAPLPRRASRGQDAAPTAR